ncbi:hypothetical protein HRJ45_11115 [Vibrio coralliilyticus]|uniref:hypothetical protein n=1 Tax=Vibrio coralliilyticus TaxID=190893 RepID=UPI001560C7D0|nr:hypothetical protein [Vibrio coralliilyticus]NRF25716.1 hypothetical protein [Vibrio coralliilyticus]NRF79656.1 hypothetical protein [Vibrio coralliilyticus]
MMRKIEFIAHSRALSFSVSSVIGGLSILLMMRFIFFMEHSVITYGFVFVGAIFQYFTTIRECESNLAMDTEEVYLFGIPAALRYQKSITGRPYIRVTSMTKSGYYRVKVYESWVSEQDWQCMLGKCT